VLIPHMYPLWDTVLAKAMSPETGARSFPSLKRHRLFGIASQILFLGLQTEDAVYGDALHQDRHRNPCQGERLRQATVLDLAEMRFDRVEVKVGGEHLLYAYVILLSGHGKHGRTPRRCESTLTAEAHRASAVASSVWPL